MSEKPSQKKKFRITEQREKLWGFVGFVSEFGNISVFVQAKPNPKAETFYLNDICLGWQTLVQCTNPLMTAHCKDH